MRRTCFIFLLGFLISCKKNTDYGINGNSASVATTSNPSKDIDSTFINILINKSPMKITSIHKDRSSSSFNFGASNPLQKVDIYSYNYYGTSGLNYQYTYYITYSSRNDTLSAWLTMTATSTADLIFNCCELPTKDPIIDGNFSASFGKADPLIDIQGNFNLKF